MISLNLANQSLSFWTWMRLDALIRRRKSSGLFAVGIHADDRPALDAAMLAGRTLVETAPASPARQALAALAERVGVRAPSMSA